MHYEKNYYKRYIVGNINLVDIFGTSDYKN